MRPSENVEFCVLVEAGELESQTLLLCESIRTFAGAYSDASIVVVSPRVDRRPSRQTIGGLQKLRAEYIELDVRSLCPAYGPSLGVYVAAHISRRPGPPIVILTDSDTLFLGEPDFSLQGVDAAVRPVDVKGMCTAGEGDPFEEYWRNLCKLCQVDYSQVPLTVTTVDRQTVRASYNGGLVAVRRTSRIFERTEEFFLRLVKADARPFAGSGLRVRSAIGLVDAGGSEFWGSRQAALSLAITAQGGSLQILPASYNVPLHLFDSLQRSDVTPIHVHYHWLCSPAGCPANPLLDGRMLLPPDTDDWLRRRLPLGLCAFPDTSAEYRQQRVDPDQTVA